MGVGLFWAYRVSVERGSEEFFLGLPKAYKTGSRISGGPNR